jgi:hypothetical protein
MLHVVSSVFATLLFAPTNVLGSSQYIVLVVMRERASSGVLPA